MDEHTTSGLLALHDHLSAGRAPAERLPYRARRALRDRSRALLGRIIVAGGASSRPIMYARLVPGVSLTLGVDTAGPDVVALKGLEDAAPAYVRALAADGLCRQEEAVAYAACGIGISRLHELNATGVSLGLLVAAATEMPHLSVNDLQRAVRMGLPLRDLQRAHAAGVVPSLLDVSSTLLRQGWTPAELIDAALVVGPKSVWRAPSESVRLLHRMLKPYADAGIRRPEAARYAVAGLTPREAIDLRRRASTGEDLADEIDLLKMLRAGEPVH